MTETIRVLYGEESIEEEFEEAWETHETWYNKEVLTAEAQADEMQQQLSVAQISADYAATFVQQGLHQAPPSASLGCGVGAAVEEGPPEMPQELRDQIARARAG
eukprot:9294702-Pyramimonas_sp.AAC.1